jgi:drug/metabolite transporter (DMT)-like permease
MTAPRDRTPGRAAALQALVAVIVWGASFAATKRLLVELSPESLLFTRTVLGALPVVVALALRGRLRAIPARDWPRLAGLALLGLVLTQLLQAWALERSTSAKTAWLVALNPVVTALLAAWLLGERLAGRVAGLAIAFAGTVLVVSDGSSLAAALALPSTRGDLLTLLSTGTWALYTIHGRSFVGRHSAPLVTAHVLAAAAAAFALPFLAAGGWRELARLSAGGWLCLAYLGVGCSGLAFMLYYGALERLEASQVAAFIYVEPLVAQVLSVVLLGEPLTAAVAGGGGAILAGVYLVSRPEASGTPSKLGRVASS